MQISQGFAARPLLVLLFAIGAGPAAAQYSTPMRDVDNPDRAPYQESVSFTLDPPFANGFALFPTPPNKRYVIEFVSIACTSTAASDSFPQVYLGVRKIISPTTTSGASVPLAPLQYSGPAVFGGNAYYSATHLKAYSDWDPFASGGSGGNGIFLNVFHTAASAGASCLGTITGHTITP
ncbi:hypothetical protein [Roseateles sp.]|uniref:hypothetical protein n=1 Tax=Roseateles sp. TaxID=1971397 RepID=UPI0025E7476C|nr:hypothetical protein [Roseateles sp.]MBV8037122.1 hypothetical protein [Roseateles sp.]